MPWLRRALAAVRSKPGTFDAIITDLESRRDAARVRVDAGSALPSETLLLDAEIARRRQSSAELMTERDAVREVLRGYAVAARSGAPSPTLSQETR